MNVLRIVADLGNSRLKWARMEEDGRLAPSIAPFRSMIRRPGTALWNEWHRNEHEGSRWAIASVNPPVAARLAAFLRDRGVGQASWFERGRRARSRWTSKEQVPAAPTGRSLSWRR